MTDVTSGPRAHRQVSFQEALSLVFKNYANFQGRSSRGAYWWWFLWYMLIIFVVAFLGGLLGQFGMAILGLVYLAVILPTLAVSVRRLHDIGKSGWWLLISLIPFAGLLILYWTCQPGQDGSNAFGPDVEAGRNDVDPLVNTFN